MASIEKKSAKANESIHSEPAKPSALSLFRYPGGKSLLRPKVIEWLQAEKSRVTNFVEPFAGGASVGLAVAELDLADRVTLVELDPDVAAVWTTVFGNHYQKLADLITDFELTRTNVVEQLQLSPSNTLDRAFKCILRNRVQRGGIMAVGAGLLKRGENGNGLASRWYPETLSKRISELHNLRSKIKFIAGDGLEVLEANAQDQSAAAFIDPPYTAAGRGAGLRLYNFHEVDSERLFKIAQKFSGPVMITYHRSIVIQRQAATAGINYRTINVRTAHGKKKRELIMLKAANSSSAMVPMT